MKPASGRILAAVTIAAVGVAGASPVVAQGPSPYPPHSMTLSIPFVAQQAATWGDLSKGAGIQPE